MTMVRSSFKSVLSLCLIAVAGYGAYLPFEIIRSHQIEEASKPMVANAYLVELKSQAAQQAAVTSASAAPVSKDERIIGADISIQPDLIDKSL